MRLNDFPMFALLFFAVFVVAIGLLGTVNFTADTTAAASVEHIMEEGQEGIEVNNGSILVGVQHSGMMNDLSDVVIENPQEGEILIYDSTGGYWYNTVNAGGSGTSGTSGTTGTSGSSGSSGTPGTSGTAGSSGTTGTSGTIGY